MNETANNINYYAELLKVFSGEKALVLFDVRQSLLLAFALWLGITAAILTAEKLKG